MQAGFLDCGGRQLFHVLLQPTHTASAGCVLFLPAFAEEMHMSRHIVASQGRQLAAVGYTVMILDPTGCGDSAGEFASASWTTWLEDARCAVRKLQELCGGPLILWGLRLGALLACDLSRQIQGVQRLVLWQPVLNGEQQVDQFLRLRTAASALNTPLTFNRKALWNELRSGRSLEVAGYELSSALALQMSQVRLNDLVPQGAVNWLEVGSTPEGRLSIAAENVIAHWQEQGVQVDSRFVHGEPFWRTADAIVNLDLQSNTMELLADQ